MSPSSVRPTQFGRIYAPDEAWLATQPPEPILEPDLPIVDTHHHLWERPDHRYLLHEFLDDVRTGHNVVATVFVECHAMYRATGPEEMRPVGQTEFVTGMAAMSASGAYGPTEELAAPRSSELRPFELPGERDFNARSFRSNVVLRWEWKPGSTLFVVWQQNRSAFDPVATRASLSDMFHSVGAPGDHVLAMKTTFWLSGR